MIRIVFTISFIYLDLDFIIPRCTASLDNFDCVTDTKLIKIISGMNKTTLVSQIPLPLDYLCLIYLR